MHLAQGAEAILTKNTQGVTKQRISKGYRVKQLDESLRKFRTKREIAILNRLIQAGFPVPRITSVEPYAFTMDYLEGPKLRDLLDQQPSLAKIVGQLTAKLHDLNIVHGDLTTSNIMRHHNQLFFIDFGLGQVSGKVEDKAVDIHLFKRALESKHHKVYAKALAYFLQGYASSAQAKQVLERLKVVEGRGRYKQKG